MGKGQSKDAFTDITPICEVLKEAISQCKQNTIPMSFVGTNTKLVQLDPSFIYTQIIKEILLTIEFNQNQIQDYFDYCLDAFKGNQNEIDDIKQLEDQYHNKTPIYWYTCDMFLNPMLNRALRLLNGDIITRIGFFISDLHRQIEQLHQEQYADPTAANTFTVYRGQGLSIEDFEQMVKIKGGLISFNNFLFASKDPKISLGSAQDATINPDQVGVFFIMEINPAQTTVPFASIAGISKFQREEEEEEVLFSMHSVFRIQDINEMDGNNSLYQVNLVLAANNDPELSRITDYIRQRQESNSNSEGWYRLGMILQEMGQFGTAEDIYQILLDQTNDDKNKASIYGQLGLIKYKQGEYQEALTFYQKYLNVQQQSLSPNDHELASSYDNIGLVHHSMGNYPKALSYYETTLEIQRQSLPLNHLDLASSYNNTGLVHYYMHDYLKALFYYEKNLEIKHQSLVPNHPNLAMSYNNIGLMYYHMRDHLKALSYYEKALEIQRQSLPLNHPDLATTSNNIGLVHYYMHNYLKALSSHEKALEIRQQSLPPIHPDLATSSNNIGLVFEKKGNYAEARTFYEHAIQIGQQSLPSNSPHLQGYRKNLERVKNK
ncbi:unnamed protein product [Adineta steineri]|uniref:Uncharacterized protein n=1 Tax=Adineta steineri TaxID=433720 RepID=A0A815R8S3_9BILA|nr:unnamed protein product [Adineta steineri]